MRTAIVTGISGQDGAYLSQHLLKKGYRVVGAERRNASGQLWRLKKLGILDQIEFDDFELLEFSNICRIIQKHKPDEIYNLAAQSFVAASFELPVMTGDVTGLGVGRILEAIRLTKPDTKFYQASSSEMFGKVVETPQSEKTPFYPRSPYAVAKVYGHWLTVNYREAFSLFACSGILFNHESPLRGKEFVTRKITIGLSKIKLGLSSQLELGNLDARRDWGFAQDYVKGMNMILSQDKPDDYVISSGENHSVAEFVERTADYLNIKLVWVGEGINKTGIDEKSGKTIVKISPKYFRPAEVDELIGDPKKAKEKLNWHPEKTFNQLVELMVSEDYKRLKNT